jgi:hypothetical protein
MSTAPSPGPEVDTGESLYRCLTTMDWWVAAEKRLSSAAFKQPDFSTDMVSVAKTPEYTLARFRPGSGLVVFRYGDAQVIGFIARIEIDPEFPDNKAHANVYNPSSSQSKRKILALKLIEKIIEHGGILREPTFSS